MSPARAAAYVCGATVLVAWFASASGVPRQPAIVRVPPPSEDAKLAGIASDVHSQAVRLRGRLATAPVPRLPLRNPFAFGGRESVRRPEAPRLEVPLAGSSMTPAVPVPPLSLLGIAEQKTADGLVRTAMFSDVGGQLIMAIDGQEIVGRYRVVSVGADGVELLDLVDGSTRRLALK